MLQGYYVVVSVLLKMLRELRVKLQFHTLLLQMLHVLQHKHYKWLKTGISVRLYTCFNVVTELFTVLLQMLRKLGMNKPLKHYLSYSVVDSFLC
jgi:hypothetical protein